MGLNEQFLHKKYPELHTSDEVRHAVEQQKLRRKYGIEAGIPNQPADKIANWLKVLEKTHLEHQDNPQVVERIKNYYHKLIITPYKEKLAQAAANVEERAARTFGIDAEYGEEQLYQRGDIASKDLEQSLDQWLDYLSSSDQTYPMWFRYYVFANVIQLADFDKDKNKFPKRSKDTVRLFPEIDRGALAHILDIIEASSDDTALEKISRAQKMAGTPEKELLNQIKAITFANRPFADQYVEAIKLNGEITPEMRKETRGEWVKYDKDSDPTSLWKSLQNKGTAWCTKGYATAETQLQGGDFYVYYTRDKQGIAIIPRIAIRMQGKDIFEVRGVADSEQNLEGNMTEIAEEKIKQLPNPETFKKKTADMKQLTLIEKKTKNNEPLNKDELTFLYEINDKIQGFGYEDDPRIKEIRDKRDPKADVLIFFDCQPEEIAWNEKELNQKTKAYIGPLFPDIFTKLRHLEHIYTAFPEGKVVKREIKIGGFTKDQLEQKLKSRNFYIKRFNCDILENKDFITSTKTKDIKLIQLTVENLGLSDGATTKEIHQKSYELGLDLCPAEVGPHFRLQYSGGEWILIAMEPILDSDGDPRVFSLYSGNGRLELNTVNSEPEDGWDHNHLWVFSIRKLDS